jgi:RNA polymerase sigma factor for flagellar operon FliA
VSIPLGVQTKYTIGGWQLSREEIIHKYMHLVKYVAGKISVNLPPHVEINDLVNEGILGLIDAIGKYDDTRGVKFETYATTRISGSILDALRAMDWVPRAVRQKSRELERCFAELENTLGRVPNEAEIARAMNLPLKDYQALLLKVRGTAILSLEEHLPNEKGHDVALLNTLRDAGPDPTAQVEITEVHGALALAVDALSPQEQTVIKLYYFEGMTLKEIKNVLNVSESRVSQIHAQAVIRLRAKLKALHIDMGFREGDPTVRQKYVRKKVQPPAQPEQPRAAS